MLLLLQDEDGRTPIGKFPSRRPFSRLFNL